MKSSSLNPSWNQQINPRIIHKTPVLVDFSRLYYKQFFSREENPNFSPPSTRLLSTGTRMDRRKPIWRSPWSRFRIRTRRHQPQGQEDHPPNWPLWTRWTIFTPWAHRSTCRTFRTWRTFLLDRKRWSSSRRRWQARPRPRWAFLFIIGNPIFLR